MGNFREFGLTGKASDAEQWHRHRSYEKSNNPYIIYNSIFPKNTSISKNLETKNLETKKYENLTKV